MNHLRTEEDKGGLVEEEEGRGLPDSDQKPPEKGLVEHGFLERGESFSL